MNEEMLTRIAQAVVNGLNSEGSCGGTGKSSLMCGKSISLNCARKLIAAVEKRASEMGIKVVVAVSNNAGRPIAIECMDDSYIASYDVALKKSYTVVALKMPTIKLKGLTQPNQSLYGIQFTNDGQIVVFGGGDPLIYNGEIVGGIGVSGGSEEQDVELSAFGAAYLKKIVEGE